MLYALPKCEYSSLTAWTTGVSNPVCYPRFRTLVSVKAGKTPSPAGVHSHLAEFYLYMRICSYLYLTLACVVNGGCIGTPRNLRRKTTSHLRTLYTQSKRITPAPSVLPRLLARSWPALLLRLRTSSSSLKALYRKLCAFVMHVFSLGQTFVHCPRFFTAAPRRSSGLVSVPMWLIHLPNQLRIIG